MDFWGLTPGACGERSIQEENRSDIVMILFVYVMCVSCSVNAMRRNFCCCATTDRARPRPSLYCAVFLQLMFVICVPCTIAACGRDDAVVLAQPPRQAQKTKRSRTVSCQAVHTHNYEVHRPLPLSRRFIGSQPDFGKCIRKRRRQEVSLVCCQIFINRFLKFQTLAGDQTAN